MPRAQAAAELKALEIELERSAFLVRHRILSLTIVGIYLPFVIRNFMEGHTVVAATYACCCFLVLTLLMVMRQVPRETDQWRYLVGQLTLMVAALATYFGAAFSGQGAAAATWALTLLPLYAAYLLGTRSALAWSGVAFFFLGSLHLGEVFWPIRPEFLASGWQVWMAQVAHVFLILRFGYGLRRGMDAQVSKLAERTRELGEARHELAASYRQLQELERARQDFVEMLVHDMKNPLTGVLGYCSLIQLEDGPANPEYIDRISVLSARLLKMVVDLLDVSRLETDQLPLKNETVDLGCLVKDVVSEFVSQHPDRVFSVDCHGKTEVTCDPALLRRVVGNLLANAVRYSPESSPIWVVSEVRADQVLTKVVDQGVGIAAEHHQRIFEKFAQAGAGRSVSNSSGLGLTFCKLVVAKHGGEIGVASEPGKGSEFWFSIPSEDGLGQGRLEAGDV